MKKILTSPSLGIFFVDTCVLIEVNLFDGALALQELLGFAKEGYFDIVIPKIVFEEYIQFETEHAYQALQQINELNKYKITTITKPSGNIQLLKKISREAITILKELQISVINLPPPKLSVLKDMAIKKEPPFKNKGRGFKDALILLSCIETMKKIPDKPAWIISRNGDFDNEGVRKLITKSKVNLECIKSIEQASEKANQHLSGIVRKVLKEQERKATDYVKKHEDKLLEFTQRNLLTSRFTTLQLLQENEQRYFTVRRIESFQAKQLLKVIPEEDKEKEKVQLLCYVLVIVELAVEPSYYGYYRRDLFTEMPMGGQEYTTQEVIPLPPTPPTSIEAEALVRATADIEAALGGDNYKNIKFEKANLVGRLKR